jgi:hypothetical protein
MTAFNSLAQRHQWTGRKREVGELLYAATELCRELEAPEELAEPVGRRQFGTMALNQAMEEAETAFDHENYDRAEHLIKVVTAIANREIARFKADPKGWTETLRELENA